MSTFQGFGKAAALFAENWGLVRAMEKEFRTNVNDFFDAVREQAKENVGELGLHEKQTSGGYRYWSLAHGDKKKGRPQLLFGADADLPSVVRVGELLVWAIAPDAKKDQLARLAEARLHPTVAAFCEKAFGGPYSLFKVKVRCAGDDGVALAAEQMAAVLKALDEAAHRDEAAHQDQARE